MALLVGEAEVLEDGDSDPEGVADAEGEALSDADGDEDTESDGDVVRVR